MAKNLPEPVAVATPEPHEHCLDCGAELGKSPLYLRYKVCPRCRFHYNFSARQWIEILADQGSFEEANPELVPNDPIAFSDRVPYRDRIVTAQHVTGITEAVITGTAHIAGMEAVLACMDYGFMGGSVGSAVGEKLALAADIALQRRLPLVLVAAGGTPRIREGVLALMQLAKVIAATKRLKKAGIPFIAILSNPTSSYLLSAVTANADIILSEPRALVGFAPKRVAEKASGHPLPAGAQTAEYYLQHGMIDNIVSRQQLKQQLAVILDLLGFKYRLTQPGRRRLQRVQLPIAPAWDRVQLARHQERPTSKDYIDRAISSFIELHGDRLFGDDPAVICGIGYLAGEAVMVIAQERGRGADSAQRRGGAIYPEGLRKAQRAMRMAARFRLPVVTFIDTPGAYPGQEAEERGIAEAIGETISVMSDLPTPVIAAIIGEGGSEGALAFSVADRILMLENAIYTPISPEAAAELLYRSLDRVDEVAASLKLTAHDCLALGIIDVMVPEPEEGAHTDFGEASRQLERHIVQALLDIQMSFNRSLLRKRYAKFRAMGNYHTVLQSTLAGEATQLPSRLRRRLKSLLNRPPRPTTPTSLSPDTPTTHPRTP